VGITLARISGFYTLFFNGINNGNCRFCSTISLLNVSFSHYFVDASLEHLLHIQFLISCHDMWNFLAVDVSNFAVQFSSVDLLAFIFSWMLVNLRFCQGRLG
jgi:hypothetical protein